MLIRMRAAVRLQDAGAERPLSIGSTYNVSDVVGRSLLESGVAELAPMRAPEVKASRVDAKRGHR